MTPDTKTFAAMVSGFLAFLCGLGLIIGGFAEAHRANSIKNWSAVEAHIVCCSVDEGNAAARVRVGYDYEMSGELYKGSFFGKPGESIEEVSRRYKGGSPLEVYVNPRFPLQSTLPVNGRIVIILLAAGLSLLLISYFLLHLVFKRSVRRQTAA